MVYDDDFPEPTQAEQDEAAARQAARAIPIRIEGLTAQHVEYVVRAVIESNYSLSEMVQERLDKAIEQHVSSLVADVTRERIEKAIDTAIADGFPVFDRYSGRATERTSIAELVHGVLGKRGDSYNQKGTAAEQAVERAVNELFNGQLKGVVATVVADFKKQADEVFKAKLVAGMKEAIGLRS